MAKSPNIAVITNISPNHLDIHKSYAEYIDAKKNIFQYQHPEDKLIINYDNAVTKKFIEEAKSEVVYFSRKNNINYGAMMDGTELIFKNKDGNITKIIDSSLIPLKGVHNIENILAVIAAVYGIANESKIKNAICEFKGIEHRIEFVREINNVSFYNDSIGSSPSRTIASIKTFDEKVILIAGGYDKKISYESMGEIIKNNVSQLFLIGQTAKLIEQSYLGELKKHNLEQKVPITYCSSLEEAILNSFKAAKRNDTILLSPASASFDMFKNFEERGNEFKRIVNNLEI